MRASAFLIAFAIIASGWSVSGTRAETPDPERATTADSWVYCDGSFRVRADGKRWKLSKFRTFGVSCKRAKSVGRECSTGGCPRGWKQKIDLVPGKPKIWWHSAWTYEIDPFAHVQWRRVRAR